MVIQGDKSDWADVLSGIPQGSVLGPTLFLVFINDLPDVVSNLVKIFADDSKLYSTVNSTSDCENIQKDLNALSEWSDKWELRFNASKCKSLHIGRTNRKHIYEMNENIQSIQIQQVQEERDLGVIFQSDLKFGTHISKCVNKANSILGLVKRSFTFMDKEMFLTLHKSLIRPHLEYATAVWSPHLQKDIFMIENVQRRATRLVQEIRYLPYEERLKKLGLPTLKYRRTRNDQLQVFKIMNEIDKLDRNKFFNTTVDDRTRGHSSKLAKIEIEQHKEPIHSPRE